MNVPRLYLLSLFVVVLLSSVSPAEAQVYFEPFDCTATSPDLCDWPSCQNDVTCAGYVLKYLRNFDLKTYNASITRAIIIVHGRREANIDIDHIPTDYYDRTLDSATTLGLQNQTLIIAPFFDRARKDRFAETMGDGDGNEDGVCDSGENCDFVETLDNPRCRLSSEGGDGRLCWASWGGPWSSR